jgi:hypothetical protein
MVRNFSLFLPVVLSLLAGFIKLVCCYSIFGQLLTFVYTPSLLWHSLDREPLYFLTISLIGPITITICS